MVEVLLGSFKFFLGFVGLAGLIALVDCYGTTKQLQEYVESYNKSVDFEWQNQTNEFVLMAKVRAFELLLRRVESLRPSTPWAHKRVEKIRDVIEHFHRNGIPVFREKHLPLPKFGEFPLPPAPATETAVREYVLKELRNIKWLKLEKRAKQ